MRKKCKYYNKSNNNNTSELKSSCACYFVARLSKLRSKTPLGVKIDFFAYQNFDNIRNYPLLWKNIKYVYAKTYGSLNSVGFFAIIDVLKYSLLLEYHQYLAQWYSGSCIWTVRSYEYQLNCCRGVHKFVSRLSRKKARTKVRKSSLLLIANIIV